MLTRNLNWKFWNYLVYSNRQFSLRPEMNNSYKDAVYALNSLQSNQATIEKNRRNRELFPEKNLLETEHFLNCIGIEASSLDALNIIHVSGTKGKGSTCAFTESMLRASGFRTGFYSSPHLIHARERIRINGKPLSEEKFAEYFWKIYNTLAATEENRMPAYFKFLTVMAYHVFLREKVDVALIEVGIGGAYDCTNVIRNPKVCGITTLDYDHVSTLGNTLEEIAWNKAGIFKPGTIAVTVPQPMGPLAVLCRRAQELGTSLCMAPSIADYSADSAVYSGIPGPQQYYNIAIAAQLAHSWIERHKGDWEPTWEQSVKVYDKKTGTTYDLPVLSGYKIPSTFAIGISSCRWPGRSQKVSIGKVNYFLDGAHTPKSLEYSAEWFAKETIGRKKEKKILLFHCSADRQPETLLPHLMDCDFDYALFCPPVSDLQLDPTSDQANLSFQRPRLMDRCQENRAVFLRLWSRRDLRQIQLKRRRWTSGASDALPVLNVKATAAAQSGGALSVEEEELPSTVETTVHACIRDAIHCVESEAADTPVNVLVTGSLHLVGGVLGVICPNIEL